MLTPHNEVFALAPIPAVLAALSALRARIALSALV